MNDTPERRLFERLKTEIPLQIQSREKNISATSIDVSGVGTAIIAQDSLPLGQAVELIFSIPGAKERIILPSTVVWARQVGQHLWKTGIQFINPSLLVISSILLPQ